MKAAQHSWGYREAFRKWGVGLIWLLQVTPNTQEKGIRGGQCGGSAIHLCGAERDGSASCRLRSCTAHR